MNTNHSQSSRTQIITQRLAYELQDDNLAITLQLFAERVLSVLAYVYVAGVITGETVRKAWAQVRQYLTLVQPYVNQLSEAFTYKTTQLSDVVMLQQEDTVREELN